MIVSPDQPRVVAFADDQDGEDGGDGGDGRVHRAVEREWVHRHSDRPVITTALSRRRAGRAVLSAGNAMTAWSSPPMPKAAAMPSEPTPGANVAAVHPRRRWSARPRCPRW